MLAPEPIATFERVEDFLDWLKDQDARYELVDGQVLGMAGGTRLHAEITANLLTALRAKLKGGNCRAYHGDMAVRTRAASVRMPDVAVYCDRDELAEEPSRQIALERPCVIFEVLSPSTSSIDQITKMVEYKALPSLRTLVFVHPTKRYLDVHERVSDTEWRSVTHLHPASLQLRDPAVTLTAEDIFGDAEPPSEGA